MKKEISLRRADDKDAIARRRGRPFPVPLAAGGAR